MRVEAKEWFFCSLIWIKRVDFGALTGLNSNPVERQFSTMIAISIKIGGTMPGGK